MGPPTNLSNISNKRRKRDEKENTKQIEQKLLEKESNDYLGVKTRSRSGTKSYYSNK